jgi:hypothetical protein
MEYEKMDRAVMELSSLWKAADKGVEHVYFWLRLGNRWR